MSEPILAAIEKLQRERDEARADLAIVDGLSAELCKIYDEISADLDEAREALETGGLLDILDRAGHDRAAAIRERDELREAIRQTIMENLHLADGDDCTLKRLKDAIGFDLDSDNAKHTHPQTNEQ